MAQHLWRIQMFGGLEVKGHGRTIVRFRTQKTGSLLACLAYYQPRSHPREELIELLWPDSDPDAGRTNLRVALSSLRCQLEPPGVPNGSVLIADHRSIRLHPVAAQTDVAEFQTALQSAARAAAPGDRTRALAQAVELYLGELLSGFYDDWVLAERERLGDAFVVATRQLIAGLEQAGDIGTAIDYSHRAVRTDPLREEAHCDLMRLYGLAGRPSAALRHYHELERLLEEELDATPAPATRELAATLAREGVAPPGLGRESVTNRLPRYPSRPPLKHTDHDTSAAPIPTLHPLPDSRNRISYQPPTLPLPFTRFFGREEEIAKLQELLSRESRVESPDFGGRSLSTHDSRLVTLTGPGGSGKTRLCLEVAGRLKECFNQDVFYVPLADVTDADLLAGTILDSLDLPRIAEIDPVAQVVAGLGCWRSLLVLDNFEQILEDGAPIVRTFLDRIPSLTCLVTSRQNLGIEGERVFPVLPLLVPMKPGTPERLMEFPAVQLFVDRAQAARPDFQITARNAAAIAALCERLEGIPLALELAAAWSLTLAPAQILSQLEHGPDLLVSRRRDISPRHRTLRSAIDWSFQLLSPELKGLFAALSVFRGGWTLDAATAVCGSMEVWKYGHKSDFHSHSPTLPHCHTPILEFLTQLQERSLVVAEEADEEMRYRLLETLREFAEEQLSPEERTALSSRHADYFLRLAEEAVPHFVSVEPVPWLFRLAKDLENFRAALAWLLDSDAQKALRLAGALGYLWHVRGRFTEGRDLLDTVLARSGSTPTTARAKTLGWAGNFAVQLGDDSGARTSYEESLRLYRALGDREGTHATLRGLAGPVFRLGDLARAIALSEESIAGYRELGCNEEVALSANSLSHMLIHRGDYDRAAALLEEGLALRHESGDKYQRVIVLENLGLLALLRQDPARAAALFEEHLALAQELQDAGKVGQALWYLGRVARDRGDYATAREFLEQSLAMKRKLGQRGGMAGVLHHLGEVARCEDDWVQAAAHYREAVILYLDVGNRIAIPGSLEALARVACQCGEPLKAARLFGAAEAARETGSILPPNERVDYERYVAAARADLGADAFVAAWAEGRALTLEQAIEEAGRV